MIPIFLLIVFLGALILILKKWSIPARGFTQLGLFVVGEIALVCNKGVPCGNCPLSFGICPIGTTQRLAFIKQFPFYITLGLIGIIGLIFGTLTCGWCCPVGFLQDILHIFRRKIKIPDKLKIGRYIILVLSGILVFLELHFRLLTSWGIGIFSETVIIAGALLLTSAVFLKRPLCRLLCPIGLIYGNLNKLSPVRVNLNKEKCRACGECYKVCITDINPSKEVNNEFCVKCFSCLKICNK